MAFNFDKAFQDTNHDSGVIKDCCRFETLLQGLAESIASGSADPEYVEKKLRDITDSFPTTITSDQSSDMQAGLKAVSLAVANAKASNPSFVAVEGNINVLTAVTDFQIKRAEAGSNPTSQQVESLAAAAMHMRGLLEARPDLSGHPVISGITSALGNFIQQAEAANPFFAGSLATKIQLDHPTHVDSILKATQTEQHKDVTSVWMQETSETRRTSQAEAKVSQNEPSPVAREVQLERSVERVQHKDATSVRTQEALEKREALQAEAKVSQKEQSLVAREVQIERDVERVQHKDAASVRTQEALEKREALQAEAKVSQKEQSPVAREMELERSVQRVQPKDATSVRTSEISVRREVRRTEDNVRQKEQSPARSSPTPVSTQRSDRPLSSPTMNATPLVTITTQKSMRSTAQPTQKAAVGKVDAGQVSGRSAKNGSARSSPLRNNTNSTANRSRARVRSSQRDQSSRGSAVSRELRNSTALRRVATMLAHLRKLSAKELRSIRLDRYDRPADVRAALAIRMRAQKLIERIKSFPLKDLSKIKGFRSERGSIARRKGEASLSTREALARREVRMYVRQLERRLLSYLNGTSPLFKRLTTELTLSDLERLVSIMGGARAARGLRRKLRSGDVTHVLESDLSNAFLGQLATAADGPRSTSGSGGGSDDSSPAQEGGVPEASSGASVDEESLVADGATPTATLTNVLMKEEMSGNSM